MNDSSQREPDERLVRGRPLPESTGQPVRGETGPPTQTLPVAGSGGRQVAGSHAVSAADLSDDTENLRREAYGGFNLGAAFFGWLVAIALTVLLASIVGAIAAALGNTLNFTQSDAQRQAGTVAISTAVALLVVLMIAYFAGGYVAGRMSRYDGGRQGAGVWLIGLLVTILAVVVGVIAGSQYDIFRRVNLPSMPVPTDRLTTGGIIALAAVLLGTLIAAFLGGKLGERYHRKIDNFSA